MTRRKFLVRSAGAAVAAAGAYSLRGPAGALLPRSASAATGDWNHDPASPIGPYHWGDIGFPDCALGTRQSPVNFDSAQVAALHGPPLLLRYEVSELAVENTGHVVEVVIPEGVDDTLQIGGDRYALQQYHFHAPSEHAVDGRLADVEAHFVHKNSAGDIAVVGVFFRLGSTPNPLLERVLLAAPETAGEETHAGEANPAELFQGLAGASVNRALVRVDSFYAYPGSLTTPGCTENVRWSVAAGGGQVSPAAVSHFHDVISQFPGYGGYPNNNRPLQALNGRVVALRRG